MKKDSKPFKLFGYIAILISASLLLSACNHDEAETDADGDEQKVIDLGDQDSSDTDTTETDETDDSDADDTTSDAVVSGDFSNFSQDKQTVGTASNDGEYTLKTVSNSAQSGFHRFEFVVAAKADEEVIPYVVVNYLSAVSSIRVDLNGVTKDESGINYQASVSIAKEGVVRLYHNISANNSEELYDVGVENAADFYVTSEEVSTGQWKVTVDVRYPGESDVDVDAGSTDFSKGVQTITGGGSSDGARISSYSYGASGGVLRFTWSVNGSTAKPIPAVTAGYNSDDNLQVWFTDLVSDAARNSTADLDISGGVNLSSSAKSGGTAYVFNLIGGKKDYKLSTGTSPNQVILEVKL